MSILPAWLMTIRDEALAAHRLRIYLRHILRRVGRDSPVFRHGLFRRTPCQRHHRRFLYTSWHPETLIGPSAAAFAFDISHSYTLPILATVGANIIAAGIIAVMSIPLAKWHIPFGQNGSHPWTTGSAS
jgi:hypothetical protein